MTASHRRILLLLGCVHVAALIFLCNQTWKLRSENTLLAARLAAAAPSKSSERVAALQRENVRLKADLGTIPDLTISAKRLETELVDHQKKNSSVWAGRSNLIQEAIEQNLKALREIAAWSMERQRSELVDAAKARLAEKAAALEKTPPEQVEKEYNELKSALAQLGVSMKKQLDLRSEWMQSDKSPESRATFRSNFGEARNAWETAMRQLGDDKVLYEELPVKLTDKDLARTPVLRSILPDLHGLSATVYLDGSVVLSPPK